MTDCGDVISASGMVVKLPFSRTIHHLERPLMSPSSEPVDPLVEAFITKLDAAITEVDATQHSLDEASRVKAIDEVLRVAAGAVYEASEVLDEPELAIASDAAIQERLLMLLRGVHHLLLMLRFHV